MTNRFIITSALNTKFGIYSTEERLQQTLDTISSIRERVTNAHITLLEMGGLGLTSEQRDIFISVTDQLFDFSTYTEVKDIFNSTDNWDIVKSLTEITCFGIALDRIQSAADYKPTDRFFKVSGRYLLNDEFDIRAFSNPAYTDKVVFAKVRGSQFPASVTGGVSRQYMSRCWSFPASNIDTIRQIFLAMRETMLGRLAQGGYIDIEHLLYLFSSTLNILEVDTIGVQGLLGPNGQLVKD